MLSNIDPRKVFNLLLTSVFLSFCLARAIYVFGVMDGIAIGMALFILMPYSPKG